MSTAIDQNIVFPCSIDRKRERKTHSVKKMYSHLLGVNLVCLIKNNTNLVIMPAQRSNYPFELITDVELVRIKQKKHEVTFCCKP